MNNKLDTEKYDPRINLKDVPEDRWEDEGGPVQQEVTDSLDGATYTFTEDELEEAMEAPMKQGMAEYGA